MGNKKKIQKKSATKKTIEVGKPEAGPSQTKTYGMEKQRQTRNKASMKMFEHNSSSGQTTPDPFSDDGEFGSDDNYDPGYDDDPDSNSTASEPGNHRKNRQPKNGTVSQDKPSSEGENCSSSDADTEGSDEDTDGSTNDDSDSVASSDMSIFDTRKRSPNSSLLEPKCKKPKVASADENTDTLSLESEVLLSNIENYNLDSSSVLPDPAELENMSIQSTHTSSIPIMRGSVAAEGNSALATSPLRDPEAAEENHTPASSLAPDPEVAEGNPAPASSPAPDPDEAEGNPAPASSPAPDPNAAEGNPAPASSPAPDPDAAEGNPAPASSPASDPEVAEGNDAPASPLVPHPEVAERNRMPASLPSLNTVPDAAERNRSLATPPLPNYDWEHTTADIPLFEFDESSAGVQFNVDPSTTVTEIFDKIFSPNIVDYIVTCTNIYGRALCEKRRPATRNSRNYNFRDTNREEILKFFGLCLLMGQIKTPKKRKSFTYTDPLYYHPVFHYVMSARRFEQLLRCIYVSELNSKGKDKIEKFIDAITKNFRECYKPFRQLSLDESLLLFRGRLAFRQYIKSKKARYGIKFFELTTSDGYVLNIMMYSGKDTSTTLRTGKKTEKIVLRLMRPYLLKGHHLYMDNYYNCVTLSQKLVDLKTHTTGTLRANRTDNPKDITKKKLKKNQHVWARKNKVYVSKWVDKRPVLMVTTGTHPTLTEVRNRFQQRKIKPAEVADYNQYMSGIDRADQMIAYYSSPRKSLRWYKKVLFHLLDVAVWNSFFIFKKYCQNKCDFLMFREELIRKLMDLPSDLKTEQLILARSRYDNRRGANVLAPTTVNVDVGSSMVHDHWPEKIPVREGSNKTSKYLKCKMCTKKKLRRETCLRCKGCPEKPALCALCFEEWHNQV